MKRGQHAIQINNATRQCTFHYKKKLSQSQNQQQRQQQ